MASYPSPTLQNLTVNGSASLTSATVSGGAIDGTPIGNTTRSTVKATSLDTSGAATLNSVSSASATLTGGTINGVTIGGTTAAPVTATNLAASGTVSGTGFTNLLAPYPTSATLAASGGSALVGFLQAGTGAVSRTEQDKLRDVVSVKDFGALGDGVTNDAAAFQAALTYLETNSTYRGGVIYIPRGHYIINSTLSVSAYTQLYNIAFQGEGMTCTTLDFSGAVAGSDGISLSGNGSQFMIKDMMITNAPRHNININGSATPGVGNYSLLLIIENVRSQFAGSHGINASNCFMTTVRDCWFASNTGNGVNFNGFHTSTQFSRVYSASNTGIGFSLNGMTYSGFDTCGSDQNGKQGYAMSNMVGVVFKNCGAESNANDAFYLYTSTLSFGSLPASVADIHGVVFDGCVTVANGTQTAGSFGGFLTAVTADSRPIDFKIIGGSSTANTTSDHAIILSGTSGSITCHKELFNESSYTAANSYSGSYEVKNYTVCHRSTLAYLSAAQSIPNSALTAVTMNTLSTNDMGGTLSSGSIVIPRGVNTVRVIVSIDFAASATGIRQINLVKNGSVILGLPGTAVPAAGAGDTILSLASSPLSVVQGDSFGVQVFQNSGGALNVSNTNSTWLSVEALD